MIVDVKFRPDRVLRCISLLAGGSGDDSEFTPTVRDFIKNVTFAKVDPDLRVATSAQSVNDPKDEYAQV